LDLFGLANREIALRNSEIKPDEHQALVLFQQQNNPKWRARLKALGVSDEEFEGGMPFYSAWMRRKGKAREVCHDSWKKASYSNASPDVHLYWSPHLRESNDPLAISRGFLSKFRRKPDYVSVQIHLQHSPQLSSPSLRWRQFSLSAPACSSCQADGYEKCVYSYKEAVEVGLVQGVAPGGHAEIIESLVGWVALVSSQRHAGWSEEQWVGFLEELKEAKSVAEAGSFVLE
jgi:hypothetical protein